MHAITINDVKKRVTVVFRGSVTVNDFMTDAKIVHANVENPVQKMFPNASETIDVHTGFHGTLVMMHCLLQTSAFMLTEITFFIRISIQS